MAIKITNYLKNLGKSIAYAGIDNIKENSYTGKTVTNNSGTMKTIYKDIRNTKSTFKRVQTLINNSPEFKELNKGYKNLFRELKTGKFYNPEASEAAFMEGMGFEDFNADFNFDEDFDEDDKSSTSISDDSKVISKALDITARNTTNAISAAVVQGAKYTADTINQTNTFMFMQQAKMFGDLNSSVLSVQNAISNLVNFNNDAVKVHIENSRKFYEESTKYQKENNAILKEILDMQREDFKQRQKFKNRVQNYNAKDNPFENGFDIKSYSKTIFKQFKDDNSMVDLLGGDVGKGILKSITSNPMGAISGLLFNQIVGSNIRKSANKLDKTIQGIFPHLMAELVHAGKTKDGLGGMLGNLLGIKISDKKSFSTSSYEKGPVPFDGKTRKSILEVIPAYLSQITAALTNSKPIYYNFVSGQWTTSSKISSGFKSITEHEVSNKLKRTLNKHLKGTEKDFDARRELIDKIANYVDENGTFTGIERKLSKEDYRKYERISKKLNKRAIAKDLADERVNRTNTLRSFEADGDSIYNQLFNNLEEFKKKGKFKEIKGSSEYYLRNIYDELFMIRTGSGILSGSNVSSERSITGVKAPKSASARIDRINAYLKKRNAREDKRQLKSEYDSDYIFGSSEDSYEAADMSDAGKDLRSLAKDIKDGGTKGFFNSLKLLVKSPRYYMSGAIDVADKTLYNFFFEHKTKTKDGKVINGFFEHISYTLEQTFDKVTDYLKKAFGRFKDWAKNAFSAGKSKVSDFLGGLGFDTSKYKSELKSQGKSLISGITSKISGHANGSKYIQSDGLTTISKGELIIPADMNPLNPNRATNKRKDDIKRENNLLNSLTDSVVPVSIHANGNVGDFLLNKINVFDAKEAGEKSKQKLAGLINKAKVTMSAFAKSKGASDSDVQRALAELTEMGNNKEHYAAKGTIGGGIGAIVGGIFAGPIGMALGSIAGGAFNILKDSDTAKNLLFGKVGDDGKRQGGLIGKKTQEKVLKFLPDLGKVGIPAALGSTLLLGFGPLGAATIGGGAALLKRSKSFNEFLFGKDVLDDKGNKTGEKRGGLISQKVKNHVKKHLPAIGASSLATVAFGPLGLIGNFALGSGIGMLATTETFKDFILGKKDPRDPSGKKRVGGVKGALSKYFISPLKSFGKFITTSFYDWLRKAMIDPLTKTFSTVGRALVGKGKDLAYIFRTGIQKAFENSVGNPMYKWMLQTIFNPAKRLVGKALSPVKGIAKGVANLTTLPGRTISGIMDRWTMSQINSGVSTGGMTAAERIQKANELGHGNYARKDFDMRLLNASDEDLAKMYNASLTLSQGITDESKEYKKIRKQYTSTMNTAFRGKDLRLVNKIRKEMEKGTLTDKKIDRYLESVRVDQNITDQDKAQLTKVLQKYRTEIGNARDAMNAGEDRKTEARKYLDSLGISEFNSNSGLDANRLSRVIDVERQARTSKLYREKAAETSKSEEQKMLEAQERSSNILASIYNVLCSKFGIASSITASTPTTSILAAAPGSMNASAITTNADGTQVKKSMDGTTRVVGSEANAEHNKEQQAKDAKEKQNFTDLGNTITGALNKNGKLQDKDKKKSGGLLSKLLGGKGLIGGLLGGLGGLAGGASGLIGGAATMLPKLLLGGGGMMLAMKAIPAITDYINKHPDQVEATIKNVVSTMGSVGMMFIKTILGGIKDSFMRGNFATGFMQILAGLFIGNKMLGGMIGKGLGGIFTRMGGRVADIAVNYVRSRLGFGGRGGGVTPGIPTTPGDMLPLPGGGGCGKTPKPGLPGRGKGGRLGNFLKGFGRHAGKLAGVAALGYGLYDMFGGGSTAYAADQTGMDDDGQIPDLGQEQQTQNNSLLDTLNMGYGLYSTGSMVKDGIDMMRGGGEAIGSGVSIASRISSAASKTTSIMATKASAFGSRAMTTIGGAASKGADIAMGLGKGIGEAAKSTAGGLGGFSAKALQFMKDLIVAGIKKLGTFSSTIAKLGESGAGRLAEGLIGGIIKQAPKALGKLAGKVATACTGIGAVALIVAQVFFAAKAIIWDRYHKWYNNAGVLYNEDLGEDVKWVSVLAGVIDSLLFNVIGGKVFADILYPILGFDLSDAKSRAQQAVDNYNNDKEAHPKGAPDHVDDVEEYNDLHEKGILDSVKETGEELLSFGKSTLTKMNQAAKIIANYVGNKADAAKKWIGNNWKWLKTSASNWFQNKYSSISQSISNTWEQTKSVVKDKATQITDAGKQVFSGDFKGAWSTITGQGDALKDNNGQGKFGTSKLGPTFARGSFYKQNDPSIANIPFNTSKDTIPQTIGDSACGPVAAVNAVKALGRSKADLTTPLGASQYALKGGFKGKDTGTNPIFFNSYANKVGVNASNVSGNSIKNNLEQGNSVILEGEDHNGISSMHPFGQYPHYVTATGYDRKTNTVSIQDPEEQGDDRRYKLNNVLSKTIKATAYSPKVGRGKYNSSIFTPRKRYGRGGDVPQMVWDFLIGKGLGSTLTAAIMGNMEAESRYNPGAVNGSSGAKGLCQWLGPRADNLDAFAQQQGGSWDDPNIQLGYLWSEIGPNGPESQSVKDCAGITDIEQCTKQWYTSFERGGVNEANMSRRINSAKEAFQKQGKGIAVAGGSTGGGSSQPQNSYGIFDSVFKPFDGLSSNLNQITSSITNNGAFKAISDIGGKVFGSMIGGGSAQNNSSGGSGSTSAASQWADSISDHPVDKSISYDYGMQYAPYWYGSSGCTTFVNEYLKRAGAKPIDLYVPNAVAAAKSAGAWKDASAGAAEGDVGVVNDEGHVIIEDGKGGWWSNMSSGHEVHHGKHGDRIFDKVDGFISTGSGQATQIQTGGMTAESAAEAGPTNTYGTGKYGLGNFLPGMKQKFVNGKKVALNKSERAAYNASKKQQGRSKYKFGRGLLDGSISNISGALSGSLGSIMNSATSDFSNISNSINQSNSSNIANSKVNLATINSGSTKVTTDDLLRVAINILNSIATNTANTVVATQNSAKIQASSVHNAINGVGQMISASNENIVNNMGEVINSQHISANKSINLNSSLMNLANV